MHENIIAINIPNAISIFIMAALGALIVGAAMKMLRSGGFPVVQRAANTTLYGAS